MSTTGRSAGTADAPDDVAAAVREAGFVHLVAAGDGDSLAAAGLLARGCTAVGVPFQANVARTDAERRRRLSDAGDDLAIAVGAPDGDRSLPGRDAPASAPAHRAARELGADPDPVLALAGAVAAGVAPGAAPTADVLGAAREAGAVERRAGVALPVADPADGLAHSTRVHAEFSGNPEAAAALAADAGFDDAGIDDGAGDDAGAESDGVDPPGDHRALASLVALAAAGDERAAPRAADAVERALRPYATPDGPFATVGGYADVLDAVARRRPGTGVALALGSDVRTTALSAWRAHGEAAHGAVRAATTGRYDGLLVARVDGDAPVGTVARLVLDWRSPEPAVLVVGDGEAAAAAVPEGVDVGAALRATVAEVGGSAGGGPRRAYARHESEPRDVVTAFREAEP